MMSLLSDLLLEDIKELSEHSKNDILKALRDKNKWSAAQLNALRVNLTSVLVDVNVELLKRASAEYDALTVKCDLCDTTPGRECRIAANSIDCINCDAVTGLFVENR